jgi:hypothetical protein
MTASGNIRIPPHVHTRGFDTELVIVDLRRGEYFGLDEVGTLAWRGLEAGLTLEAIARTIVDQYDVGFDRAVEDLSRLVGELVARGLIVRMEQPR